MREFAILILSFIFLGALSACVGALLYDVFERMRWPRSLQAQTKLTPDDSGKENPIATLL